MSDCGIKAGDEVWTTYSGSAGEPSMPSIEKRKVVAVVPSEGYEQQIILKEKAEFFTAKRPGQCKDQRGALSDHLMDLFVLKKKLLEQVADVEDELEITRNNLAKLGVVPEGGE